jgi:glycosyltransferase involved in cell wall biosynthesis
MDHICMIAYTDYRTDTRVRREAEALASRGDNVTVISLAPASGERINCIKGVCIQQVRVSRYRGSNPARYLASYLAFFLLAAARLSFLHLRRRFQVVQVHTLPDFMVFTAFLPKLLGAKVILDLHDLSPELYRSKFGLGEAHPFIRLVTWIERASIAFADRGIAVNKVHLEALLCHGNQGRKFSVLLNLPDTDLFSRECSPRPTRNGTGLKLVYHGTLAHRHGLGVLLQAMALLRDEIEGLELQIIGEGDDLPNLFRLAEELDLSGKVHFLQGFFPPEEIIPLIREADVGVVPFLLDDFTRTMLPVKLLEYVALGLPAISARSETVEAYFDSTMVAYFKPGDPADLAEVIRSLARNRAWREELCARAERFNQEFAWERHKMIYLQLIDELCASGRQQLASQPATRGEPGRYG